MTRRMFVLLTDIHRAKLKKWAEKEQADTSKYKYKPTIVRLASNLLEEAIERLPQ